MKATTSFSDKLKSNAASIAAIFSTIATIGGAVIYVEGNFASAADLSAVIANQEKMIKNHSISQSQNSMFQLEYYDDRLKSLRVEKSQAEVSAKMKNGVVRRSVDDIQAEIDNTTQRKELVRKTLIEN